MIEILLRISIACIQGIEGGCAEVLTRNALVNLSMASWLDEIF